jgi:hypothetical protein
MILNKIAEWIRFEDAESRAEKANRLIVYYRAARAAL